MEETKKKQLFPYFAYVYSKQIDPKKYGETKDFDTWSKLLDENPADMEAISAAASKLPDDEWEQLDKQYQSENVVQSAKSGGKLANLKKLQKYKKGKKVDKKMCACGCEIVEAKGKGGKMISRCSCGCKKETGGALNYKIEKELSVTKDLPEGKQKWERRLKSKKIRKFKG